MDYTLIISLATLVVGAVFGYFFATSGLGKNKSEELKSELEDTKNELESYKADVSAHFEKTADLLNNLTHSYKDVYQHLAGGAQSLGASETSNLALEPSFQPKLENETAASEAETPETELVVDEKLTAETETVADEKASAETETVADEKQTAEAETVVDEKGTAETETVEVENETASSDKEKAKTQTETPAAKTDKVETETDKAETDSATGSKAEKIESTSESKEENKKPFFNRVPTNSPLKQEPAKIVKP